MNSNFYDGGIRAVHKVITSTRFLGYKNTSPQTLASILDHADALGFMLMDDFRDCDGQKTIPLFRLCLQEIQDKFEGFQGLTPAFDENMKRSRHSAKPVAELAAV